MLLKSQPAVRFTSILLTFTFFAVLSAYAQSKTDRAADDAAEIQRQIEIVKAEMRGQDSSSELSRKYKHLRLLLDNCTVSDKPVVFYSSLGPAANLCIAGSLDVADPNFNRVTLSPTGTGIGDGTVGNCSLDGVETAVNHDVYNFNLTACAVFPTEITATLCGPVGCQHVGNVDGVLTLYRNVAAGDPLTANNGLPGVFNPGSPCTNARAAQDDLGDTVGIPNSTGGSTCNQVNTSDCVGPCNSPSDANFLPGFRRQLGDGRFTIVVSGFSDAEVGAYNLYVDAPAAGCIVSLAPSAAPADIGGRVVSADGRGIRSVAVTLSGGNLPEPRTILTGSFGYYKFEALEAGQTYFVTVAAKRFTFAQPSRVISLQDNVSDADFVSEQ